MRANVLGCSGTTKFEKVCMDKPFLNADQQDCRTMERNLGEEKFKKFCKAKGDRAWFTALSANQACCGCGDTLRPLANVDILRKWIMYLFEK